MNYSHCLVIVGEDIKNVAPSTLKVHYIYSKKNNKVIDCESIMIHVLELWLVLSHEDNILHQDDLMRKYILHKLT